MKSDQEILNLLIEAINNNSGKIPKTKELPFDAKILSRRFGSYNNAVIKAGFTPLPEITIYKLKCGNCNVEFERTAKNHNPNEVSFCSHSCAASYNNKIRKQTPRSDEFKERMRNIAKQNKKGKNDVGL